MCMSSPLRSQLHQLLIELGLLQNVLANEVCMYCYISELKANCNMVASHMFQTPLQDEIFSDLAARIQSGQVKPGAHTANLYVQTWCVAGLY